MTAARTPWGLGQQHPRLLSVWQGMKARCLYAGHQAFASYGGRGITICERWLSFENFLADLGDPPDGMTLERNDVNGNYEPDNCRWASREEQAFNTRRSLKIEFNGETLSTQEWARRLGLTPRSLRKRFYDGWPLDRALSTPKRSQ